MHTWLHHHLQVTFLRRVEQAEWDGRPSELKGQMTNLKRYKGSMDRRFSLLDEQEEKEQQAAQQGQQQAQAQPGQQQQGQQQGQPQPQAAANAAAPAKPAAADVDDEDDPDITKSLQMVSTKLAADQLKCQCLGLFFYSNSGISVHCPS